MKYVLVFHWVFLGGDSSVHTSVHPYTFDTYAQCDEFALTQMALPVQLQKTLSYTCPPGNTAYELQGRSPQRIDP